MQGSLPPPKEYLWNIIWKLAACATFVLAGKIVGLDRGLAPSWTTIFLFFFVSGLLAFLVCVVLNNGRPSKNLIAGCIVLAFLPAFMVLAIPVAFIGLPLLFLAGIVGFIKSKSPVPKVEQAASLTAAPASQSPPAPRSKAGNRVPARKPFYRS